MQCKSQPDMFIYCMRGLYFIAAPLAFAILEFLADWSILAWNVYSEALQSNERQMCLLLNRLIAPCCLTAFDIMCRRLRRYAASAGY